MADLRLIRHAPSRTPDRLAGRTDVAADVSGVAPADWRPARLLTSPARRCVETAAALFPGVQAEADPRLWEQDLGAWERVPLTDLPDLGPLDPAELAAANPHGGESFCDVVARVTPALEALEGEVTLVVHAGTVRAALARAIGSAAGALAFEVRPLSLTRIRTGPTGWSVACVNA